MVGLENTSPHPVGPASSLPEQSRHRAPRSPGERIVRQAQAIDAWVTARRERERVLHDRPTSRDERMDAAREVEALRWTHDAIKGRCARGLDAELDGLRYPGVTAVVAHRHAWFVDKLAGVLGEHGVIVLVSTDNGAEALGAVVAEQPDIVLVGGRLAMMHGPALLAQSRRYAPGALLAAQASDQEEGETLREGADSVFLRHHPPAVVADALVALHRARTSEPRSRERHLP